MVCSLYKTNIRSYNRREVKEMKKKMTVQEFNQDYMLINEQQMVFEDYPEKEQFDYIRKNCYHEENNEFVINYMGMLSDIRMGEPGSYRMDGIPFGYNAFRFIIESEV